MVHINWSSYVCLKQFFLQNSLVRAYGPTKVVICFLFYYEYFSFLFRFSLVIKYISNGSNQVLKAHPQK